MRRARLQAQNPRGSKKRDGQMGKREEERALKIILAEDFSQGR